MCILRVHGSDPRLARFPEAAGMAIEVTIEDGTRVSHDGDRRTIQRKKDPPGTYGVHVSVSNRDWDDLSGQFAETLEFVARHQDALRRLAALRPTSAVLDFPAEVDPSKRRLIVYDVVFPVDLCRAASAVGLALELTLYVAPKA